MLEDLPLEIFLDISINCILEIRLLCKLFNDLTRDQYYEKYSNYDITINELKTPKIEIISISENCPLMSICVITYLFNGELFEESVLQYFVSRNLHTMLLSCEGPSRSSAKKIVDVNHIINKLTINKASSLNILDYIRILSNRTHLISVDPNYVSRKCIKLFDKQCEATKPVLYIYGRYLIISANVLGIRNNLCVNTSRNLNLVEFNNKYIHLLQDFEELRTRIRLHLAKI